MICQYMIGKLRPLILSTICKSEANLMQPSMQEDPQLTTVRAILARLQRASGEGFNPTLDAPSGLATSRIEVATTETSRSRSIAPDTVAAALPPMTSSTFKNGNSPTTQRGTLAVTATIFAVCLTAGWWVVTSPVPVKPALPIEKSSVKNVVAEAPPEPNLSPSLAAAPRAIIPAAGPKVAKTRPTLKRNDAIVRKPKPIVVAQKRTPATQTTRVAGIQTFVAPAPSIAPAPAISPAPVVLRR